MAFKKDLSEKLNVLVDYIQEKTKGNDWVTLRYRDIAELVGTASGSSVTKRLMESLKDHENILYKIDMNPKKAKKPLQFQYVNKETKFAAINNERYKNLSTEEVNFIKDKIGYRDHKDIYIVLAYVNYLKSELDAGLLDLPDPSYVSDLLLMLEQDIIYINEFLVTNNILVDTNGKYSLFLSEAGLKNSYPLKEESVTHVVPKESHEEVTPQSTVILDKYQRLMSLRQKEDLLLEDLRQHLQNSELQIATMERQLNEGHQLVEGLVEDNQSVRKVKKELQLQVTKLEATVERSAKFKNDLIDQMQELLEIFNWQVQQVALQDSNEPMSVKNSTSYRAKLSKQFTDVGNEFYNNILDFIKG